MTTNGIGLARRAAALRAAGLDRVSVSLDTLDPDHFTWLTGGGALERTLAGIDAALATGLTPLKLNAVLLASSWRRDVPALLSYAAAKGIELRFIELMSRRDGVAWARQELVPAAEVRGWLEQHAELRPIEVDDRGAPARRTRVVWQGQPLLLGWITPRSQPFCDGCARLRLDARGHLRRCLMDPATLDLRAALAAGDAVARQRLDDYLAGKRSPAAMVASLPMSAVGG